MLHQNSTLQSRRAAVEQKRKEMQDAIESKIMHN